jgi:hypothetical protein
LNLIKVSATDREVRNFGLLFAGIAVLVAAYLVYAEKSGWIWFLAAGVCFLAAAFFFRTGLRPVYVWWMRFAFVLGWINTRVLLTLAFYLVVTPTGLILRLLKKDPMEREFDRSAASYWKPREARPFDASRYKRLF